jgi:hypothetical protein
MSEHFLQLICFCTFNNNEWYYKKSKSQKYNIIVFFLQKNEITNCFTFIKVKNIQKMEKIYPWGIEHESSFLSALVTPHQLQQLHQELPICLTNYMIFASAELLVIALFATGTLRLILLLSFLCIRAFKLAMEELDFNILMSLQPITKYWNNSCNPTVIRLKVKLIFMILYLI